MSFRDDVRSICETVRSITGPDGLDIRVDKLSIIRRVWLGGKRGAYGGFAESVVADLDQIYRMVHVSLNEIYNSGGRYETGDVKIGPITPAFDTTNSTDGTINDTSFGSSAGGWSVSDLHPTSDDDGTEFIYRLTGEHQGDYRLVGAYTLKPFSYYLIVRRITETPSPDSNIPENQSQF